MVLEPLDPLRVQFFEEIQAVDSSTFLLSLTPAIEYKNSTEYAFSMRIDLSLDRNILHLCPRAKGIDIFRIKLDGINLMISGFVKLSK